MNDVRSKLDGIADIEPPLLPPDSGTEIIIFSILGIGLVLLLAYLFWRYRYSLRGQARRRLLQLQQVQLSTSADNRYTAYQLAAILRIGLGLRQVSESTPLPSKIAPHRARWHAFVQQLYHARYAPADVTDGVIISLIKDATFWLRRWP